jgi:acyl carrier protein
MMNEVEAWLLSRNPGLTTIDYDQDLIDTRVIDSLTFTEFLLLLEELLGHELEFTEQSAVAFRTLRGIEEHIVGGQQHDHAIHGH